MRGINTFNSDADNNRCCYPYFANEETETLWKWSRNAERDRTSCLQLRGQGLRDELLITPRCSEINSCAGKGTSGRPRWFPWDSPLGRGVRVPFLLPPLRRLVTALADWCTDVPSPHLGIRHNLHVSAMAGLSLSSHLWRPLT